MAKPGVYYSQVYGSDAETVKLDLRGPMPKFGPLGWRDNLSDMTRAVAVGGGPNLALAAVAGNVQAWKYTHAAGSGQTLLVAFHVDHDLCPTARTGYVHVHTAPVTAGQTGFARWKFEYVIARGHNQAAFSGSSSAITLDCTTSGTARQHQITEDTVGIDMLEPDTLILGCVWRDGANETCTGDQFLLFTDFHYQTDRTATTTKAPAWDAT